MTKKSSIISDVGAVVIGRNEGERLECCLKSVLKELKYAVYVDSGSTDNSIVFAKNIGLDVIELDISLPFTAARGRNSGYHHLLKLYPELKYVQFVDGDCELAIGWIKQSVNFLDDYKKIGAVCGRRRERHPEHSIYNRLIDIESDTPIGETKSCGGDAMFRVETFALVGGYRRDLIAGEEPELCVRVRRAGWKIWRIDTEMTIHDADMTRFSQWWKRSIRGGYAFAEGAYLHGRSPERHWVRESLRIWFWAVILPLIIFGLATMKPWLAFLFIVFPLQVVRLTLKGKKGTRLNLIYAFYIMLGKFPEILGQLKFIYHIITGKRGCLIEYK